ncbi:MAG TPA: hypothetical protein VL242_19060 [Sorangium sp.]|nr:hypothetical protein [Sorangium sp.]
MWFEKRTFNPEHLCFHEALQFFASYFGSVTLCRFPIEEDGIIIKTPGCDQVVKLHGAAEMIGFLTGNSPQPISLAYSLAPTPIHLPGDPPERTGELPANRIGPTLCVYLLGYAFERHHASIKKKQPKKPDGKDDLQSWDKDLQFFRHIRNGCFHGNRFQIWKGQVARNPPPHTGWPRSNVPEWRNHIIMIDDSSGTDQIVDEHGAELNGRKVIGEYLYVPDVLPLLYDMGNRIAEVLKP